MKRASAFVVLVCCGTPSSGPNDAASDSPPNAATDAGRRDSGVKDTGSLEDVPAVDAGLNNCGEIDFVDRSGPADDRTIKWDLTVVPRCLIVAKGQSVTWLGSLPSHPLTSKGGDTPTPIMLTSTGTSATIGFPDIGDYGFVCTYHPPMQGVIRVR